jgi:predicted MPP superfamily phosphohydrolase
VRFAKKRTIQSVLAAFFLAALFLAVWSFFIEPDRLIVNEVELQLNGWPAAFGHLKIAVIGDLHVGSSYIGAEKLKQIVAVVNEKNPDLILLPGDFVIQEVLGGHFVEPEAIAENLKALHARLGVYAVLGNHDRSLDAERVRRALESAGIRVLENDVTRLEQNGEVLWLGGLSDLWTSQPDIPGTLGKMSGEGSVIMFTHNPDVFPLIPSRVILTVAAHTHGGQVNLPLLGRLIVPSHYGQRYAAGHVFEDGRHLFVTTGVGTSIIPVRFRVPPEIALLTINPTPLK